MLATTTETPGVFVPSFGWAIFGGFGNNVPKVQVLPGLDAAWTNVADTYNKLAIYGQCVMQVFSRWCKTHKDRMNETEHRKT